MKAWSDFRAWKEPFSEKYMVKFSAFFQACVGNFDTIPKGKVVGTLYLGSTFWRDAGLAIFRSDTRDAS